MGSKELLWFIPPGVLPYWQAWRRSLFWIIGSTVIVSAGVGVWQALQQKEYLCEVEFVPPSLEFLSAYPPRLVPAEPADMERFYSYLQSPALWQAVVDSFHLIEHYGISSTDYISLQRKLQAELAWRTKSRITKNSSLYFYVTDPDPDYAYKICRFILDKVREQVNIFTQENKLKLFNTPEDSLIDKKIHEITSRLSYLRKTYNIITIIHTDAGRVNLGIGRDNIKPEAMSYYDEAIALEKELYHWIDLKSKLRAYKAERSQFLSIHSEKLWLIIPPARPLLPTYPRPLRWMIISAVVTFSLLSAMSIYASHMRLLRSKQATPEIELFEKVS
ncbi:MAG: hypothetical protein NZZ60_05100 [Bacteroidia bacterium]|nr:hypothetical protein [Bacteroidia bacterium]MDW8416910.1 hypothetical protein [Bacteroidia bacterium]